MLMQIVVLWCDFTQNHIKEECQLVKVSCPNEGCHEEITRSQLDDHLQQCQYRRQSRKEEAYYDQQKVLIHDYLIVIYR